MPFQVSFTLFMSLVLLNIFLDHDERIPLFLDTAKIDPELPYTPFLK